MLFSKRHIKRWDDLLPQTKFAYNSITNQTMGQSLFSIIYTKHPNHTVDLATLPRSRNQLVEKLAAQFSEMLKQMKGNIEEAKNRYKLKVDAHRRAKLFNEGDLVMIRIRKECFPVGTLNKLKPRKLGPFAIKKKWEDNTYLIDIPPELNLSPTFNILDIYKYYPLHSTVVEELEMKSKKRRLIDAILGELSEPRGIMR